MNEIKVKAYGLIELTKPQYLIIQSIVFSILVVMLLLSFMFDLSSSEIIVLKYLNWGIVIIIVLELIETVVMLTMFSKKRKG